MWAKKHNLITSNALKEGFVATSITSEEMNNLSIMAKIHGKHKPYCLDFGKCREEVYKELEDKKHDKENDYCVGSNDICGIGTD